MEKIYGAKNDLIFKKIFGELKYKTVIKGFLSAILDIPEDEYDLISVESPFLSIEDAIDDKIGILDVKLKTKNGKIIDIEMQVAHVQNMRERALWYTSKMITEQIKSKEPYKKIQKVVSIIIAGDGILITENGNRHNKYLLRNEQNDSVFSDKIEVNVLDLKKLPSDSENPELTEWIDFFNAKSMNSLERLAKSENEAVVEAAEAVIDLNTDEKTRIKAEQRENALRSYITDIEGSKEEGIKEGMAKGIEKGMAKGKKERNIEIAKNLLSMNLSVQQITQATGLTAEEIEKL